MPDLMRHLPAQKMLYLHSDLESFLISNLKKTSDTQKKMPALAKEFLGDGNFAQRFPQMSDLSKLSFMQVCALLWLVNLYNFEQAVDTYGSSQVKTLDAHILLSDMPATLGSLSRFFGHDPSTAEIQQMMDPQVVQTNAKDQSKPYGNEQRQFETRQIKSRYAADLASAEAWISPLITELGVLDFLHSHRLSA